MIFYDLIEENRYLCSRKLKNQQIKKKNGKNMEMVWQEG